ncbi:AMP-dependent synthetase/ligase [Amycolatopsis alkalitolerans]|uniref:Long-chain fatty acid--CoA ligase n=1 Tax=Amycolatopsis alkalitolerans TaxID=2547244 RepID=A0A5C4M1K2_9PSEU|nr:long-chain fatty acid--CoA ligase [Amycolatopsis alkalitolerans]TNC24632.1 long-chain fatty acid--CoA ligase [Amycolatopsis alkalitolerans]
MNAADDVFERAARDPGHAAFARKIDGTWQTVTSREFAEQVAGLAAGLIAAGIKPGDRVGVMSGTSYAWVLCDLAILTAGAVTVPVYETSSAAQVAWVLADSGATAVFTGDEHCRAIVEQANVSSVGRVWPMDPGTLDRLGAEGASVPGEAVRQRRLAVTPDSLATVVYTSGTTGRPKGCLLSHGNLAGEVGAVAVADGISDQVLTERASLLLFLPLAHILARVVQFAAIHNGALTAHTSDVKNIAAELETFRPSLVLAVPRVFEKLHNAAARKAAKARSAGLFRVAEETAIAYSRALEHGRPGPWSRIVHRLFDRLVYAKLRAAMGGRVTFAVSGGAPLSPRLAHFLRGAGVNILEGYGLTETTAGVTLNLPASQRIGTVGRPLPGWDVRIAADGEVLVRGPGVFGGYRRDERSTREAFDEDGWLRTGDLGRLDDGYLTISGRKKDLIVTATGKNVAPARFEDRLRGHWLIEECMLVGDRRPYVGALVTLDPNGFADWKQDHRKPASATVADLRHDRDLVATVQSAVDEINQTVSHAEAVKRFEIVPARFDVSEELTPTQKVRREYVLAKYADDVAALYAAES